MKRTILFFVMIVAGYGIYSQSLTLYDLSDNSVSNSSMTISSTNPDDPIEARLKVKNNNTKSLNVVLKKRYVTIVPGTSNSICWKACVSPSTFQILTPIVIAAGQTNTEDFRGDYSPNGNYGTSTIVYTFWDLDNPVDSVNVAISFDINTGITDNSIYNGNYISMPYPNPAVNHVCFNYQIEKQANAYISIYNVIGKEVKTIELSNHLGKITVDLKDFYPGHYFYTLFIENRSVKTGKLIVTK